MSMTDPVADMLTRLRNGSKAKKPAVSIPSSKLKQEIIRILKENNFVRDAVDIPDNKQGILRIYLRYAKGDDPVIKGLQRVSRPGLRKFVSAEEVRLSTHNVRGITIISTSAGLMTNYDAARKNIGGEIMIRCW